MFLKNIVEEFRKATFINISTMFNVSKADVFGIVLFFLSIDGMIVTY